MVLTKTCTKCGKTQPISNFGKNKLKKDGLQQWCKQCRKNYSAKYYKKNKEKISEQHRKYHLAHRDEILQKQKEYAHSPEGARKRKEYYKSHKKEIYEYQKEYAEKNRELIRARTRKYQRANKDKVHEWHKSYREKHAETIAKQQKIWRENNKKKINERRVDKLRRDQLFRKKENIRCNIRDAFRSSDHNKKSKTRDIVGCDLYFFKEYLLNTWKERYGTDWNGEPYHFHHIIPLSSAKTEEDVIRLNHYTNLVLISPDDHLKAHEKEKRL